MALVTQKTQKLRAVRVAIRKYLRLSNRGQSLVEVALLFPVLLVLLSGLLEFGFLLNEYLTLQDAVRNAARFSSDSDFTVADDTATATLCTTNPSGGFPRQDCCLGPTRSNDGTVDFYRQTACLVNLELNSMAPDISMDCLQVGANNICEYGVLDPTFGASGDLNDMVVSVFSVDQDGSTQLVRFGGANGWSYADNYVGYGSGRNQNSGFTLSDISSRLDTTAPNTGYVLVEVFYNYDQKLKLPWITAFVRDPVMLHAYTFMPLTSAEPTPTPISP
jgi:hypothetical protein